ncbi:MAG: HD domain-containing phosphohydrolase [Syntrophaceae bacterium]
MPKILVVDDEHEICSILDEYFTFRNFEVFTAQDGLAAIGKVKEDKPHVVLLDISMPVMGGIETLIEIRKIDPFIGVIMVSAITDEGMIKKALDLGASDYITKPIDLVNIESSVMKKIAAILRKAEDDLRQSNDNLRKTLDAVITAMARIVENRDPYTSGHQEKVARLSEAIALELGLPAERVYNIKMAALIHDLGKVCIPAEILSKPGNFSELEYTMVKSHSMLGYDILKDIDFPQPVAEFVLQHHERLDGSGYPNQKKGDEIFLEARIIAVADTVDAMSSHRPYRPSQGMQAALEEIVQKRGRSFDPDVVDACCRLIMQKGFEF